jgi:hypothetical protein
MIPKRLESLYSRLQNLPSEDFPKSFEDEILKHIASTALKLVKEGVSPRLTAKFQEQEELEEFIIRAAMIIYCSPWG